MLACKVGGGGRGLHGVNFTWEISLLKLGTTFFVVLVAVAVFLKIEVDPPGERGSGGLSACVGGCWVSQRVHFPGTRALLRVHHASFGQPLV